MSLLSLHAFCYTSIVANFWALKALGVQLAICCSLMGKVTNRSAGLKRAPSAFALFCGHISQTAAAPGIRLNRKQPVNRKDLVLQMWILTL